MRHTFLLTTFLTLPGLLLAEEFPLAAPVTAAQIYLQGATLTRTAQIDLPAGEHRLLIPFAREGDLPSIDLTGAALGAVELLPEAAADGRRFLTPEQEAALSAFEDAQEAEQVAEDARIRAAAEVKAAEDQLAFLRSVDGGGRDALDSETLLATLDLLGTQVRLAETARADARAALREAERRVRDAGLERAQAELDLEASGAQLGTLSLLAIDVTVPEAGAIDLALESFTPLAGWSPRYDVSLDADDRVTLDRKVEIWQRTDLSMREVTVSLSTADPFAPTAPAEVFPDQARLQDDAPELSRSAAPQDARPAVLQDLAKETGAAMESAPALAQVNFDGPVVTYDYPLPVTLPTGGRATLSLDAQSVDARVFNRASPRFDETAFLMAEITNSTGEPLLPGPATMFREGERIGEAVLPLIPAGDEVELAFGPQQHLRLEFVALDNETGDRGVFFTSGTRRQDMVFRIRNLGPEEETVETRFALPFSEEEALDVTLTARPAPDTRDVEDRRGVAQWDLEVAAGTQVEVEVGVTLEWPEGETLEWQP